MLPARCYSLYLCSPNIFSLLSQRTNHILLWMVLCVHDSLVAKVSERTLHVLCSLLGTFGAGRGQAVSRLDRVWGILQVRTVVPTSEEELASQTSPVWAEWANNHVRQESNLRETYGAQQRNWEGNIFGWAASKLPILPPACTCMHVHTHTHTGIKCHILLYSWFPTPVSRMSLGLGLAKPTSPFPWLLCLVLG